MKYTLCSSSEEGEIKIVKSKTDRYFHTPTFPIKSSYLRYLYHNGTYTGPRPNFSKENIVFFSEMNMDDPNYIKNRIQRVSYINPLYSYYSNLCTQTYFTKKYEEIGAVDPPESKNAPGLFEHIAGAKEDAQFDGEIAQIAPNIKNKFGLFAFLKPHVQGGRLQVIVFDHIYDKLDTDDLVVCEIKQEERQIFIGEYFMHSYGLAELMNRYVERVVTTHHDYVEYNVFRHAEFDLMEMSYTVFGDRRLYSGLREVRNAKLLLQSDHIKLVDCKESHCDYKPFLMGLVKALALLDGVVFLRGRKLYRIGEEGELFTYKGFDIADFL